MPISGHNAANIVGEMGYTTNKSPNSIFNKMTKLDLTVRSNKQYTRRTQITAHKSPVALTSTQQWDKS